MQAEMERTQDANEQFRTRLKIDVRWFLLALVALTIIDYLFISR